MCKKGTYEVSQHQTGKEGLWFGDRLAGPPGWGLKKVSCLCSSVGRVNVSHTLCWALAGKAYGSDPAAQDEIQKRNQREFGFP